MTKVRNFPARRNARRIGAIRRMIASGPHVTGDPETDKLAAERRLFVRKTTENNLKEDPRSIKTKVYRGVRT